MKDLLLNPQIHDIALIVNEINKVDNFANIDMTFGDNNFSYVFTKDEAKCVGEWLVQLSKQLKE